MSTEDNSAEIYELNDARRRLRSGEIELGAYATAGGYLATVREDSGLSIEEISKRTHIKQEFLQAIETNNFGAMPSRPFAIGFVKGYAEALGLEPEPIVSKYKEDANFDSAPTIERVEETQTGSRSEETLERSDMSLLAVLAVLAFILWCAWHITRPRDVTTPYRFEGVPQAVTPGASDVALDPGVQAPASTPATGVEAPELPDMIEARILERINPVYPRRCEAGAAARESVDVTFTITAEGGIAGERVVNSSNACFDRASLNAIRRWRFEPRTIDGTPRAAFEQKVTFPYNRPQ